MFEVSSQSIHLGGYLVSVTDVTARMSEENAASARWEAISQFVNSLEEGVSVWDADMRFLMCNDQYMRDVASYRDTPFEVGMTGRQAIEDAYDSGDFMMSDEMSRDEFVDQFLAWVGSYSDTMEIAIRDGRTVIASSKATELGGYLITTRDVTDKRNSEERARALLYDATEALEE